MDWQELIAELKMIRPNRLKEPAVMIVNGVAVKIEMIMHTVALHDILTDDTEITHKDYETVGASDDCITVLTDKQGI